MSDAEQQASYQTYLGFAPFGAVLHLVVALAKHGSKMRIGIRAAKP